MIRHDRDVRFVPKADSCSAANNMGLFNDLICGSKQRSWDIKRQGFGGLAVDHKLEFCRLLDRKFIRFCASQDLIDVSCRTLRACVDIRAITEESAFPCPRPKARCE
jgi:hypothetical protein